MMSNILLNKCKTCKWWGYIKDRYHDYDKKNAKVCGRIPHATTSWRADDTEHGASVLVNNITEELIPENEAGAMDGSGYWGAVFTGPEFSCVLHEPKEE